MFITLQFPLFDRRYLLADASRTEKPAWPKPDERDRIRYFGEVISRNKNIQKEYKGPWDDEKKYCNARSVIDLCGTGKQHFYQLLHQSLFRSRVLFRRFQSDGKCGAKFEIGFNDAFEKSVDAAALNGRQVTDLLCAHIEKYLLCPVKIRIGSRLTSFVPLIDAGKQLASACYWATTMGKRSFAPHEVHNKVEHCEPAIFVQADSDRIQLQNEWQQIQIPELAKENIQLYHQLIPYTLGRYRFKLKAWIITLPKNKYNNPLNQHQFQFYNNTLRYLRINLLRIHVETVIQQQFLHIIGRQAEQPITDQQTIIRLYQYMHKVLLNLSNIMRNKQPQELLVQAAFRLDEMYAGAKSIHEILEQLKYFMLWLKTRDLTSETKQVIAYLDTLMSQMEQRQAVEIKQPQVFISYNHKDAAMAKKLKARLEAKGFKIILDSDSMKAGTDIEQFIGESLRAAQATIGIISSNSLLSGWVAIETVNMLSFEKLFKDKRWIACCLDEDFTKDGFVDQAVAGFGKRLKSIRQQMRKHDKSGIDTRDLNDEKTRLLFLKANLDGIVGKLKNGLYIPVAGRQFTKNFPKILEAVTADAP